MRDGETLTTDGPFAETKEVLGGYYLIEVETLDEALEWGAKVPGSKYGTIEVRPVVAEYERVAWRSSPAPTATSGPLDRDPRPRPR